MRVHVRPRFRCLPATGRPHTFSTGRVLPRDGACERCDRGFSYHDGPVSPRRYMHVVPDIARALFMVGGGATYRTAGQRTRQLSGVVKWHWKRRRWPEDGGRDWGLVADWVELFAEIAAGPDLLKAWPASALLCDALPFGGGMQRANAVTGKVSGGRTSWTILCAMAPQGPRNELKVVQMRAVPGKPRRADWEAFFLRLSGQPAFLLSDEDQAIIGAARAVWPGITTRLAWDKLELRLKEKLGQARIQHGPLWQAIGNWHPLRGGLRSIFREPAAWLHWVQLAQDPVHYHHISYAQTYVFPWIQRHLQPVAQQFSDMPYWPSTASPIEAVLARVRAMFEDRAYSFTNEWRTNLLLELITNELAGTASVRNYQRRIRAAVEGQLPLNVRHFVYGSPRLR